MTLAELDEDAPATSSGTDNNTSPTEEIRTVQTRTTFDHARRTAAVASSVLAATFIVTALVFAGTGGHWFVVRTPSMGTAAPVGTLVLTRPTTVADLHVGDVVAFHPTDAQQLTYTHRIVAIHGDSVTTRGDINGSADPWRTTDRDLIGKAVTILPGIGYLARALPLLLVGGLLVVGITRWWLRADRRGPVRMLGFSVLYILATLTIRPFVGLRQLATTTDPDGASITAVSTGLMPIRVEALKGHGHAVPVHLGYGQVGTVRLTDPPKDGKFALAAHLDLPWTMWLLLLGIWALPVLWVFVVGFRREHFPAFEVGLPDLRVTPVGSYA